MGKPIVQAVGLLTALALTGCTDQPTPRVADPEPTVEPTTSAPTTPAEPALSPEETVRAWVAARNVLLNTGDASGLRPLTGSCESCSGIIDPIIKSYRRGGSTASEGWQVRRLRRNPTFDRSGRLTAAILIAGGTTIDREGASPIEYAPEKVLIEFTVKRLDERWRITEVIFLS